LESIELGKRGFIEAILVPLKGQEKKLGIFVLLRHNNDEAWSEKQIQEVQFVAQHATLAWENVIRYTDAKKLAFQDTLTGLYNLRYLRLVIDREIVISQTTEKVFSILFIDLDNFKRINDLYGHSTGSQLLVEVAQVIVRCVRSHDIVVRYGGDEFVVVLKATNLNTAMQIAERMRVGLASHPFLSREGLYVKLTACIGVAVYPLHAQTPEELIYLADKAMYKGKNSTRNQVNTADPNDLIGQNVSWPEPD